MTIGGAFEYQPPTCYALTLGHTGQGNNPLASPTNSTGCTVGRYVAGATVNLSNAAPATGWQIAGWAGTDHDSSIAVTNTVTMPAGARTVNVNYSQIEYSLTLNVAGSGSITKIPDQTIYHYGDSVQLTGVPAAGWYFDHWSGDLTGTSNPASLTMNGNKTVTATFTFHTYTLSVSKSGTGSGTVTSNPTGINCGSDCSEDYGDNTSVTLSATAATGSTFGGWSGGGCSGTSTCMVTMDAAKTVTASFTLNTYVLSVSKSGTGSGTVTSNPTGINCGSDCSEAYAYSSSVTLTATPATGSTFAGWSGGGCSGTGTCTVTVTAATTVTATFNIAYYTLAVNKTGTGSGTVTSNPTGINCGLDCSEDYAYNTSVTLTAVPATGSTFSGWSGACSGTGTCHVSMTTAKTVTANFVDLLPGKVTLVAPSGNISSTRPTYSWNADPKATWYYLSVNAKWYAAADVGCGSGTGTCSTTPTTALTAGSVHLEGADLEQPGLRSLER